MWMHPIVLNEPIIQKSCKTFELGNGVFNKTYKNGSGEQKHGVMCCVEWVFVFGWNLENVLMWGLILKRQGDQIIYFEPNK